METFNLEKLQDVSGLTNKSIAKLRRIEYKKLRKAIKHQRRYERYCEKRIERDLYLFTKKILEGQNRIRLDNRDVDFETRYAYYRYDQKDYDKLIDDCLQVLSSLKNTPYVYERDNNYFTVYIGVSKLFGYDEQKNLFNYYDTEKLIYFMEKEDAPNGFTEV